jgi:hypothetical protein
MIFDRSNRPRRSLAATAALFLAATLISAAAHAVTYSSAPVAFAWVDPSAHNVLSATSSPIALRSLAGCGTSVPITDDTISDPIALGFNFSFAGVVVDSVRVASNGRLQFLNQNPLNGPVFDNTACGYGTPDPFPLPNANIPYTMKVYAADIDPTNIEEAPSYVTRCSLTGAGTGPFGTLPCSIRFATTGTSPNQQLVVTWNDVPAFTVANSPQGDFQLQALVRENGTFIYQYGANTSVPAAEIGWQGAANSGDYAVPSISPLPPQNRAIEFYVAGPANILPTDGTPQSAVVDTAFATQLQVTVTDLIGNPVSGATVTFAAPASGPSAAVPVSATTDGSGVAVVTATANGVAGSYSVTATVAGAATPATFDLTNLPGAPAIILTIGPQQTTTTQTTTINTAFPDPLEFTVEDAEGNPVPGVTVDFTAPVSGASATLPASTTTDANGAIAVTATANSIVGSYAVVASVAGVPGTVNFNLTNAPGTPTTVTASSGTPQSTTIGTAFPTPLQATVTDVGGNPVPGVTVSFAAPGSGASAAVAASAITDGSGVASVTATANLTAGGYSVTASVAGVVTPATFSLTNTAGAPASIVVSGGSPQSATINTAFASPLQVLVTDAGGNPVGGVTVNFAAPGSGASATVPATASTSGSGIASVTATANATAGSYSVTASVVGVATPATFSLTNTAGSPASVTATSGTPQSTAINTAFAAQLQATVTDVGGNAVSGVTVTFAAPGSGASATVPASAITNASGVASVSATANATAGSYSVSASVAGVVTPATFSLTNTAGSAASVAATSGTPQSTAVNTAFAAQLQATVTDVGGNPVSGVTVSFSPPGSGASATLPASAVTNGSGVASVTATANATAGSYSVSATVVGVVTPATFSLTNTAGVPASISASAGTPQSTTVNTAFGNPLQATVTDSGGNPVIGATVNFTAPGSGASATVPPTATTNSSGVASVTATANGTAGSYSVTASVAGVATPATFSLTNNAVLPTKLAVTSVNGGASPSATIAFNVVVQAQDAGGTAQNVVASTLVTLSLNTGTGTLGGTLTCTIAAGASSCTVVGVTYSKAETGVVITATRTSGDTLASGNSAPFNVLGGSAPSFASAVSRKVHGSAGTFDLPLSAVPTNPTTEPRGSLALTHTIVFTFDKAITDATATVTEGAATAAPLTFSGNTVIVNLTGVSDQQYVTISLSNVSAVDGGSGGSASVRVGFLRGDVTQNRVVTVADLALVNAQLAQVVTSANFLKDINASGTLSVADTALTNANLTRNLPAP